MLGTLLISTLLLGTQAQGSCCSGMAQFASDPAFIAMHESPLPLEFKASTGHMVHWKASDGQDATGFYVPPKKGARAAVVLVHEFWGLNDYMKREAERLNDKAGYAVLAVDLYDGKTTTDAKVASEYMSSAKEDRCNAIVSTAVSELKGGGFGFKAKRIGSIGFCFGGGWSFRTAVDGGKNVQACVMYYGMPDTSPEAMGKLKAPVLMMHATQDKWINQDVVSKFQVAMKANHHSLQVVHYDAAHGFANPSNPKYDKKDGDDAMKRSLAFFKKLL